MNRPYKKIGNYGAVYNSFAHGAFETEASLPAIIQRWRVWQSAVPQYSTIPHFWPVQQPWQRSP
jgi:hypothetical protein